MIEHYLPWFAGGALALGILGFFVLGRLDMAGLRYTVVIDKDRKDAGWGNHWAVVAKDDPEKYIFLGAKDAAERRCQDLNCRR